jgi:dienelactone hydrolase
MTARIGTTLAVCIFLLGTLPAADDLDGTARLKESRPLDEVMVDGIDRFALNEIARVRTIRPTPTADSAKRFAKIIGAVDPRSESTEMEFVATSGRPALLASNDRFSIYAVRWPVLDGITAEGLWLKPPQNPIARVVAVPDADWTPEMIAGLNACDSRFASDLATLGCEVLVPCLINRDFQFSSNPTIGRSTNLSHREFVYRQAFEVGRHVIGYEVQKVLAAVDRFANANGSGAAVPIAVVGVGEGGLLALYSGAVDRRIDGVVVSGYFDQREGIWREPLYRNVWGLLKEFGDAELANMIAPRKLFIEASPRIPIVTGPADVNRKVAAPGAITSPKPKSVAVELKRAKNIWQKANRLEDSDDWLRKLSTEPGAKPLATETIREFVSSLVGRPVEPAVPAAIKSDPVDSASIVDRQKRQVGEMVSFTQRLLRQSHRVRDQRFAKIDRSSIAAWEASVEPMRQEVYEQLIGKLPDPSIDPNPRTRKIIDQEDYSGYDVVLDVYPDVNATGVLLMPKNLKAGEKRPVVVCQHGLEGTPMSTIGGPDSDDYHYYKAFSVELVNRGFIVYAPQNPYRGQDRFRTLQRKSNPLGRSLFSYIIPQHLATLRWLASLPNVDRDRIGFYGLSYGGKTAMRVPPFLVPTKDEPGYCLSICSADFNEWVSKNASVDVPFSYVWTGEYEIFEWNMAHIANYAELAMLMTPRPFMVERGHDDGVGIDQWVAFEYAKVRRHYNKLGVGDQTEIEFFDGPHTINGQGTYRFLHRHLGWPELRPESSR